MSLSVGTRIGPYEILAPLGAGGMGEVYRAMDTHLKRSVAIKVLPTSVASDANRLARFQREAEVLAALNHPNIAHIHGLEKCAGVTALVMELVEGDDLSVLIARGPIPLADPLPIAKQIADGLEAAHEQGMRAALAAGQWTNDVLDHALECDACSPFWMTACLAEQMRMHMRAPVPLDADVVWWKAKLHASRRDSRRALAPIIGAQVIALAGGAVALFPVVMALRAMFAREPLSSTRRWSRSARSPSCSSPSFCRLRRAGWAHATGE